MNNWKQYSQMPNIVDGILQGRSKCWASPPFPPKFLEANQGSMRPMIYTPSPMFLLSFSPQMYFYASYVFQEAGIPYDKIQYYIIGTGSCELIASMTCVRTSWSKCIVFNQWVLFCLWFGGPQSRTQAIPRGNGASPIPSTELVCLSFPPLSKKWSNRDTQEMKRRMWKSSCWLYASLALMLGLVWAVLFWPSFLAPWLFACSLAEVNFPERIQTVALLHLGGSLW